MPGRPKQNAQQTTEEHRKTNPYLLLFLLRAQSESSQGLHAASLSSEKRRHSDTAETESTPERSCDATLPRYAGSAKARAKKTKAAVLFSSKSKERPRELEDGFGKNLRLVGRGEWDTVAPPKETWKGRMHQGGRLHPATTEAACGPEVRPHPHRPTLRLFHLEAPRSCKAQIGLQRSATGDSIDPSAS